MKRNLVVTLLLVALLLVGCGKTQEQKDKEIATLVTSGKIEEARDKVLEYYENDEDEATAWLMAINNHIGDNYKDKLVIQEGWTWELDDNYSYIRGRVKNTGDETIRYFEVTAQYLDSNENVMDTDYTNSGEKIRPGDSKEFEIMHRHDDDYEYVRVFVEEVSLE